MLFGSVHVNSTRGHWLKNCERNA